MGEMWMDDYFVWPDGTWCEGFEFEEMIGFMSDDYQHFRYGTPEWIEFTRSLDEDGFVE